MTVLAHRKKSELALLYALPNVYTGNKKSRLYALQKRLQKVVIPQIKQAYTSPTETYDAVHNIFIWGSNIGWLHGENPTGALISFCIEMIEDSPIKYDPQIMEILQELSKHLDNGGLLQTCLCVDGRRAAEKWQELFEDMEKAA